MATQKPNKNFVEEMKTWAITGTVWTKSVASDERFQMLCKQFRWYFDYQVQISESGRIFKFGEGCKDIFI